MLDEALRETFPVSDPIAITIDKPLKSIASEEHQGPERSDVSDVDHGKFGNTGAAIMGSTADKASGLANEAAGKAKQGIGNVVGSDKLKAEGAAQELKGDAQKATGDAKAAVKDAANRTAKAISKNL
jgi:uncharacterized protein YjbJ (UPF0337 family)